MRKLKLQVQLSVDGFAANPECGLDWMTWDQGDQFAKYVNDLTDSIDTILLGRKMTDEFIKYWEAVDSKSPEYIFARKMCDAKKIVFTKTLQKSDWNNTVLAKGKLEDEIKNLKSQKGKDIVVYGGANFVSNLIKKNLIDEYHLFINPTAIGKGLPIFNGLENYFKLKLIKSSVFDSGIVVNHYEPKT